MDTPDKVQMSYQSKATTKSISEPVGFIEIIYKGEGERLII